MRRILKVIKQNSSHFIFSPTQTLKQNNNKSPLLLIRLTWITLPINKSFTSTDQERGLGKYDYNMVYSF